MLVKIVNLYVYVVGGVVIHMCNEILSGFNMVVHKLRTIEDVVLLSTLTIMTQTHEQTTPCVQLLTLIQVENNK